MGGVNQLVVFIKSATVIGISDWACIRLGTRKNAKLTLTRGIAPDSRKGVGFLLERKKCWALGTIPVCYTNRVDKVYENERN